MAKLKDFLKLKVNSANNQRSLEVKSRKLKELDCDLEDILNLEIKKEKKKWRQ